MECMMVYAGNDLLNMVIRKAYAAHRNDFMGSGSASGLNYTFDVIEPPIGRLVAGVVTHNLEVDLKVNLQTSGNLNFQDCVELKATGKLMISGGMLSLTGMQLQPISAGIPAAIVAAVVNRQVIPSINAALINIPVPQLTNLFGSGLAASPKTGAVINGPALEVGARITGQTGIAAADSPAPATLAALNSSNASNALIIAMVSSAAVNVLSKKMLPPLSYAFDRRATAAGFGAGIKGTIKATHPILTVTGGNGTIKTTISFSNLKGGIKAPMVSWKWVSLTVPDFKVVVQHTLGAVDSKGVITLTGLASINVSLSWPFVLNPVEALVEDMLDKILKLFKGQIESAITGKKFVLFELPPDIPGTGLDSTLSFDPSGGVRYFNSSVQALVRVS